MMPSGCCRVPTFQVPTGSRSCPCHPTPCPPPSPSRFWMRASSHVTAIFSSRLHFQISILPAASHRDTLPSHQGPPNSTSLICCPLASDGVLNHIQFSPYEYTKPHKFGINQKQLPGPSPSLFDCSSNATNTMPFLLMVDSRRRQGWII